MIESGGDHVHRHCHVLEENTSWPRLEDCQIRTCCLDSGVPRSASFLTIIYQEKTSVGKHSSLRKTTWRNQLFPRGVQLKDLCQPGSKDSQGKANSTACSKRDLVSEVLQLLFLVLVYVSAIRVPWHMTKLCIKTLILQDQESNSDPLSLSYLHKKTRLQQDKHLCLSTVHWFSTCPLWSWWFIWSWDGLWFCPAWLQLLWLTGAQHPGSPLGSSGAPQGLIPPIWSTSCPMEACLKSL